MQENAPPPEAGHCCLKAGPTCIEAPGPGAAAYPQLVGPQLLQLVELHESQPDLPDAGRDIFFLTFFPPHFGQSGASFADMGTSRSKHSPHAVHSYS
jgi:hypothetical protein